MTQETIEEYAAKRREAKRMEQKEQTRKAFTDVVPDLTQRNEKAEALHNIRSVAMENKRNMNAACRELQNAGYTFFECREFETAYTIDRILETGSDKAACEATQTTFHKPDEWLEQTRKKPSKHFRKALQNSSNPRITVSAYLRTSSKSNL